MQLIMYDTLSLFIIFAVVLSKERKTENLIAKVNIRVLSSVDMT